MSLPQIYSAEDLSKHFGIPVRTLLEDARKLGCFARAGDREFFTLAHVEELISSWRATPASSRLVEAAPGVPNERPFTAETLAREWNVSAQQIRNLIRTGELPHFKLGRLIRIPFSAAKAYQEQTQAAPLVPPTPQEALAHGLESQRGSFSQRRDKSK